jgi:cell wall-associated NlpC family hydrolase
MRRLADFVGIPYKPHGIPPEAADCWSLVRDYAQEALDQHWPPYMYDAHTYMSDARRIIAQEMLEPGGCWERVDKPQHGDLLIFKLKGFPTHCAVYLEKDQILHTMHGRNSTVEPLDNWRENLVVIYRWKNKS